VNPDQIYLSNGSDELISQIVMGCCEPGKDAIAIVPPTFGMYAVVARTLGVDVVKVPLTQGFQLDIKALQKIDSAQAKVLFIPTPNNPTANCFHIEDIETVIASFSGIVVVDEAYIEFADSPSFVNRLADFPNLVVCQTFSKAQGMAGVRLGMSFAHPEIIHFLNRIKAPYNLNSLTLSAALHQIENQKQVKEQVAQILSERKRLETAFTGISIITECFPSDANFLLIRFDDSKLRYHQLLEAGIVVRNPSNQIGCQNTLRISVGLPEENTLLIQTLETLNSQV
jgi:histidinol-phosphate aminotransferase